MAGFVLTFKKLLNLIPFLVPAENPPEGQVSVFIGGDSGNDLMGLDANGNIITLAKGTIVSK